MNDLDVDPALAAAVLEIETHISEAGWDQPARLYALVETARLVEHEPALAAAMGLDSSAAQGSLTPVEQDQLAPDSPLERVLESVTWPPSVSGCAAVVERLVLPPEVDAEIPEDPAASGASSPASTPTGRRCGSWPAPRVEGRRTVHCRMRAHDDDLSVVGASDLVPGLLQLLAATLEDDE